MPDAHRDNPPEYDSRNVWKPAGKLVLSVLMLIWAGASISPSLSLAEKPSADSTTPRGKTFGPKSRRSEVTSKPDSRQETAAPKMENGYLVTSFAYLSSYEYRLPDPVADELERPRKLKIPLPDPPNIPAEIKALSGTKITIKGFMIPIEVDPDGVSRFALVKNQMACCYGVAPNPNEWIYVVMERGKKTQIMMDQIVTVYGTLRVSGTITEGGINSLYQLECERVKGPVE